VTGSASPPARRRRKRRRSRFLVPLLGAVVVFGLGVALGEALHDNPKPGGTQTILRTLNPLPLIPAPGPTVTITTSKP
jgi:hypothetical protein